MSKTTNFDLEHGSAIATRAARGIKGAIAIVLASTGLLFLMLAAGVMGSSRSAPITRVDARSGPFVTAYGNTIQQLEYGLTPESVAATSDGGYFALTVRRIGAGEFAGTWASGVATEGAEGYFCAKRAGPAP